MKGVWVAKAIVQKGISLLPASQRVNYVFQKYVTRRTVLDDAFVLNRLAVVADHLEYFRKYGSGGPGFRFLELGTGWHPIVPVCMYLHGAEEVFTADLEELGEFRLTVDTLDRLLAESESGRLQQFLPEIVPERLDELHLIRDEAEQAGREATLERLRIRRLIGDARRLPFDEPLDLITSNHVLEHIPGEVIVGLLREFARVSRPGTVISQLIDLCDHHAYTDPNVSTYNFLRYPERRWRLIDNSVQPMNRLRINQYRELFHEAGVPITHEVSTGSPEDVDVPLAPPFDSMPIEDVAVNRSHVVSVM